MRACLATVAAMTITAGCGDNQLRPEVDADASPQRAWLADHAHPFATVDPVADDRDLAPLGAVVGDAHLVGVGEASHGTSEFFRMKHRVLRYLVEHEGFTGFGIEADLGDCLALDHYVLTGEGDPRTLVPGMGFWTWSTEEVVELVTWMRAYNADGAHPTKLRFVGFDLQDGWPEIDGVLAYLHGVDPTAAEVARGRYAPFRLYIGFQNPHPLRYDRTTSAFRATTHADLVAVEQELIDHRATYLAASSEDAYELAVRMAHVVVQLEAMVAVEPGGIDSLNLRDLAMADNADWWLGHLGSGARLMLWAHNGHINQASAALPDFQWTQMGTVLHARHGRDYVTAGFATLGGQVRALIGTTIGAGTIPAAPPDAFERAFADAGFARALLDLRTLDPGEPGAAWLLEPHPHFEIGASFDPAGLNWSDDELARRFDLLIFVRDTTAARALEAR